MNHKKQNKTAILKKLKIKYRIAILNDDTIQELGHVRISRLSLLTIATISFILLFAFIWAAIAYTPIRELIPGYPDAKMRNDIIQNKIRLDSIEIEIDYRDQYFANLNSVIRGEKSNDFLNEKSDLSQNVDLSNNHSISDSILRHNIDLNEKLSLPVKLSPTNSIALEKLHFFSPVRGMVTNEFNPLSNHFGTDVVAGPNEVVKATLDGTVTMAAWTIETGHVIQIQHDNNLISVYKHNAELLKKVGNRVKAGDAIAIIGNSGELTTGPHLHFEIWQNGVALNPEELILF